MGDEQEQYREVCNPKFEKISDALQDTRDKLSSILLQEAERHGLIMMDIAEIKKSVLYLVTKNGNGNGKAVATVVPETAPRSDRTRWDDHVDDQDEKKATRYFQALIRHFWNMLPAWVKMGILVTAMIHAPTWIAWINDLLAKWMKFI